MTEAGTAPWLVLRTRSRHENVVETLLSQKGISAYLPKHRVTRQWQGKRRALDLPLFPGYVFVQPEDSQYETLRYIRGSCGLVFAGAKPAVMRESELDAVKILCRSGAALDVCEQLVPGCRVTLVSGPFKGAHGDLVRINSQERLVVNVHALNSSVSVEVDMKMVVAH